MVTQVSLFTEYDIHLFKQGKHYRLYEKLGAHRLEHQQEWGTYFAVWAPNASRVSVIGDFNGWNPDSHEMQARWDGSGIWEVFITQAEEGNTYKYSITNRETGAVLEKGDPFAAAWEVAPKTASVIREIRTDWNDQAWMKARASRDLNSPFSIYEMHIGSWKRDMKNGDSLSYRQLAPLLADYLKETGFTHVEFLPVMEHPFFGSWGYQSTGYFAPSSRYGTPEDFMFLVNFLHTQDIGVILDWVPSHFPTDEFALANFDGTALYEHEDPKKGFHPDWSSLIFNYDRHEVRSFLISSALCWMERFHADGIRVDAVASMLYLDYSRKEGEWIPNIHGSNENLGAIQFLQELNTAIYENCAGAQMIAEESTSWSGVSRPVDQGGLGFGMKWMMGWMHDSLEYFGTDPLFRRYHQNKITFSLVYAFSENFMLPLSHDEVVHGKGAIIDRMPGDDWQQFANLRLLYGWMFTHPGTKLLFMGQEFAQRGEWNHDAQLPWELLQNPAHAGIKNLISDLNKLYKSTPALYKKQFSEEGFEWIDASDFQNSVLVYLRKSGVAQEAVLVIANMTPEVRESYRVGVPDAGTWEVILNTDHSRYWGANTPVSYLNKSRKEKWQGRNNSMELTLPPLSILILKRKAN